MSRFVTSPSSGYANRPNRAIDGKGTFTLQDLRPCQPLLGKTNALFKPRAVARSARGVGERGRVQHAKGKALGALRSTDAVNPILFTLVTGFHSVVMQLYVTVEVFDKNVLGVRVTVWEGKSFQ